MLCHSRWHKDRTPVPQLKAVHAETKRKPGVSPSLECELSTINKSAHCDTLPRLKVMTNVTLVPRVHILQQRETQDQAHMYNALSTWLVRCHWRVPGPRRPQATLFTPWYPRKARVASFTFPLPVADG